MFFRSLIATSVLAAATLAAPVQFKTRDGGLCQPNFQGTNSRVQSASLGFLWSVPTAASEAKLVGQSPIGTPFNTFRPEFTGQPQNDYIIKLGEVSDNSLLVQPSPWQKGLVLGEVLPTASPSWDILCTWCADPSTPYADGAPIGTNCNIISKATGTYVQQNVLDQSITLESPAVGSGSQSQLWSFYASPQVW